MAEPFFINTFFLSYVLPFVLVFTLVFAILQKTKLHAYTVSLLCILLGFYGVEEYVEILWKYYHYFKDRYPNETFSDGPLIGLSEIRERKKESS